MNTAKTLVLLAGVLLSGAALAGETPQLQEVPEAAPPPPPPMEDGKAMETQEPVPEPDVTIVQRKDAIVEEYRIRGRLYQIKVKPFVGPVYYLIDRDGDGKMETKVGADAFKGPIVPQWVLFSW